MSNRKPVAAASAWRSGISRISRTAAIMPTLPKLPTRFTAANVGPWLVPLALFSGAAVVYACGPFFPQQLLDDRSATLLSTPSNSFAFEAAHLVPASPPAGSATEQQAAIKALGDKALTYLKVPVSGQQCNWLSFANQTACADGIAPDDLTRAIGLYAAQAAAGSAVGQQSLAFIAGWALADPARATGIVRDPVSQRLLVAYALAGGALSGQLATDATLAAVVDAINKAGIRQVDGASRLAALAYRVGRFDLAATLVDGQSDAMAEWVKAKLALRKGDEAAAATAFAAAAKAFPVGDSTVTAINMPLIKGQLGVLTLARGQYVEALAYLYVAAVEYARQQQISGAADDGDSDSSMGYQGDMSYIAERVLTTDELKTFVDARVPASAPPPRTSTYETAGPPPVPVSDQLRYLLARRLVRDGRIKDSLAYFPVDGDLRFSTTTTAADGSYRYAPMALRKLAGEYGAALDRAQHAWTANSRAQGWFHAAQIATADGMELMGYEQGPDFMDNGGSFDTGSGRTYDRDAKPADLATAAGRADAALTGPYITVDEKHRYAASESVPDARFHYRYIGADDAIRAADLLPPRSQAYAAVMCEATRWMLNTDPARATKYYRQYVAHGAYVDFGSTFGGQCAAPDFGAARFYALRTTVRKGQRLMRRVAHKPALLYGSLGGVAVLLVAAVALSRAARRRRRR